MTTQQTKLAMWDIVCIARNPATVDAGIAGLTGVVHGFTTPSATGIEPTGELREDFAFNVFVETLDMDYWLDPTAINFVSRPEEIAITVGTETFTYKNDETDAVSEPARRPWWKFW